MSSFTADQQEYLKGFFAGAAQRPGHTAPFVGQSADGRIVASPEEAAGPNAAEPTVHGFPVDELSKEERVKLDGHGLDIWDTLLDNAARDRFPEGGDVFRYKFHGLFYVSPAQESLMLRCRIPGCVLRADQLEAIASIARDFGGGYAHVTTRGNLQAREIMPRDSVETLLRLREAGLVSQGAGADNVRNITASPTSGFDPDEVFDVLPHARAMHHYILNTRELYDLPRKFNIAFDNGGAVSVCADTNDIGFLAARLNEESQAEHPAFEGGLGFRVQLCGITGHKQFAQDCGLLVAPEEAVALAAAMLRVYLENGDRTNRKKARLKYLIDDWGVEKFLEETAKRLAFPLRRVPLEACQPRRSAVKLGYVGVHPQVDPERVYVGVSPPVGRLEVPQMEGLARLARSYGSGELRLTVWQSVIVPNVRKADADALLAEVAALGLEAAPSPVRSGLVACTGSRGCKYAATDTKGHALALAERLEAVPGLDEPINVHLTGCPHSCAQHYIGDIGMLGCKTGTGENKAEGYHILLGGGVDADQGLARELFSAVPFDRAIDLVAALLEIYLAERRAGERFVDFARRRDPEPLRAAVEERLAQPAAAPAPQRQAAPSPP